MGILGDFAKGFVAGMIDDMNQTDQRAINNELMCKIYTSIIKHISMADGQVQTQELSFFENFVDIMFKNDGSFLDWSGINQKTIDSIRQNVRETWRYPLSITEIKQYTRGDSTRKLDLFEIACIVTASDSSLEKGELPFLKALSKEFSISAIDRDTILKNYGLV